MDEFKLQYLKENGYVEFDKEEIRKEIKANNISSDKYIENWISKYKYYRLMSDGQKMFYDEEYLISHSIEEIEAGFAKISQTG